MLIKMMKENGSAVLDTIRLWGSAGNEKGSVVLGAGVCCISGCKGGATISWGCTASQDSWKNHCGGGGGGSGSTHRSDLACSDVATGGAGRHKWVAYCQSTIHRVCFLKHDGERDIPELT